MYCTKDRFAYNVTVSTFITKCLMRKTTYELIRSYYLLSIKPTINFYDEFERILHYQQLRRKCPNMKVSEIMDVPKMFSAANKERFLIEVEKKMFASTY